MIIVTAPMEGTIVPLCAAEDGSDTVCDRYEADGDDAFIVGENVNDDAGASLASAGDMNGNGLDDLLVSASYYAVNDLGAVYLMLTAY